jgi:hypothetical protein
MLRWCALLGAGALLVHELGYRVSFGAGADRALAAHGHAYLSWALALVAVLAGLGAVRLAVEVAGARRRAAPASPAGRRASLARRWAAASVALVVVHVLQEGLEGVLGAGHPGLAHALTAHGGWVALLAAVGLGLLIAFLVRGAEAIVERVARSARARRPVRAPAALRRRLARPAFARLEALAEHLAGRGPPLACP